MLRTRSPLMPAVLLRWLFGLASCYLLLASLASAVAQPPSIEEAARIRDLIKQSTRGPQARFASLI